MTGKHDEPEAHAVVDEVMRPTGAWVVAAFLVVVIIAMWGLVSLVFLHRS